MNIKVNVQVEIGDGAKVSLTKEQTNKITKYVVGLLGGEVTRTIRRRAPRTNWTKATDALVLNLDSIPRGKQRSREISRIAREVGCARSSVTQRKHQLLKTMPPFLQRVVGSGNGMGADFAHTAEM
jgi:hypothetical protein